VLDGAGDAQSNINLGVHGLAGLADLVVSRHPAGVYNSTGGTHDAAEDLGQLLGQLDAALHILADAAAHGDDHVGTDQVHQLLGGLDHLHHLGVQVVGGQGKAGLNDLAGVSLGLVESGLLHYAGTDGSHAGTEAGADDGRHQMAAESGTGHLQVGVFHVKLDFVHVQGGAVAQEVHIGVHVDVQVGAVGGQTGVQAGRAAGTQVTADVGGADQQHLGLELLHHVADDLGVGVGGVLLQQGVVTDIHAVSAVAAQLLGDALDAVAQQQTVQLGAALVGQLAALGDQLVGGGHHLALALLAEDPYAASEGSDISTIKSRHILHSPFYQMICLVARMPASLSQVALSAPSSIMPAPFWGGVKDLKMFVGEPFRPMVVGSMRGSSFRVS